ncbi:MAG: magnesium transporter CorA family protein [Candidatus Methanofastidiosa archaeon]|nr:magnesium transporter CorA family protein [Candidatus Methanofastidiosa archaeon]
MIRIFKTVNDKLEEADSITKGSWIDLVSPTEDEIITMSEAYGIPVEFIKDPLDLNERPRTESEGTTTLIVLRTPQFSEEEEHVQFVTMPLGIIITEPVIITVSLRHNDIVDKFISGRVKNVHTAKKSRFVLQFFYNTSLTYLDYLKRINARTNSVENELHQSMKNEELIKLLDIEKSLVYFATSLKGNEIMMERLQRTIFMHLYPEDEDLFEDVIIENRQAIEMANVYTNILSGTMDAFASVISNNLNMVMKVLTSVTIVLMLPTLIASIYGMNVDLPLQNSAFSFGYIMILSVITTLVGVMFFFRKNWF